MTWLKNWIREWLGIETIEAVADRQITSTCIELVSLRKQLEDLRRIVTVQEKPKVRVQAASFREVRQFVGSDDE
jgi:hypothetical protein